MEFNFFHWIREGVRQSVMLGVSDAIGQLGTPDEQGVLHESLRKAMPAPAQAAVAAPGRSSTSRKRLGKSLKEINGPAKTA
ncbi:MAG: hypothetical protein R3B96_05165 [Pirellulaceae bacterium]